MPPDAETHTPVTESRAELERLQTTSGCDGDIRVWDVSNPNEQEPTCIKVISELLGEEEPDAETQCQAIWHPSGRYFVVGTKSHGTRALYLPDN